MNRLATTAGLAALFASGLVATASAATLSDVSGPVLVDSGKGFAKVASRTDVAPGSRILVSKGGQAVLAYADGCTKTLGANSITSVVDSGACKQPATVAGQAGTTGGISTTLLGAGAGILGGTLIGYAIGQGSSDQQTVYVPISR